VNGPVMVITGSDATIVNDALHRAIDEALGDIDAGLALEEFAVRGGDMADSESTSSAVSRTLDALNTPPFLVARRVVVLREAQHLAKGDVDTLVTWAAAPTPGVILLAAGTGIRKDSPLAKVAKPFVSTTVGTRGVDQDAFIAEKFAAYNLSAPAGVVAKVRERLGENMARVDSIARTLQTIFGSSPLTYAHIEPYLGEAGEVPIYLLTDAIDNGKVADAIRMARRILDTHSRAAVTIVMSLEAHYQRMIKLDGSGATGISEVMSLLGISTYPAQRAVASVRNMGSSRLASALHLVVEADHDLKGGVSYGGKNDDDVDQTELTVIEVLVARLARMSEVARRS